MKSKKERKKYKSSIGVQKLWCKEKMIRKKGQKKIFGWSFMDKIINKVKIHRKLKELSREKMEGSRGKGFMIFASQCCMYMDEDWIRMCIQMSELARRKKRDTRIPS